MAPPSVLCCFSWFREPGQGEATGGLLSNFHLVRALASFAEVTVLSLDRRPPSSDVARASGYSVDSRPTPSWPRGVAYLRWRTFVGEAVRGAIARRPRPAAVVATTSVMPALIEASTRNLRTVAVVRAYENFGWRAPGARLADRWLGLRLEAMRGFTSRRAIGDADLVIANSRFMASQVARVFGPAHVAVLYPCIDLVPDDASTLREPGPMAPAVGFVDRASGKNLAFVAELARRMPDVRFHVFGPARAGDTAVPNLVFHGWQGDRVAMFGSAPLWIVPSSWQEPFGRVAAEARALGLRVLVADRGGLPEAADETSVLRTLDPPVWVSAIRRCLERPPARDERVLASRRAISAFGIDAHDRQVRTVFSRLMDPDERGRLDPPA